MLLRERRLGAMDRAWRWVRLAVCLPLIALAACATAPREPYSASEAANASLPGYEHIRIWLDANTPNPHDFGPSAQTNTGATYLALSGGGGNGAYGAGILNGWTEAGTRPNFTAVSGVSTGALIAPFAFLGPSYDGQLKGVYTDGVAETLVQEPNFIEAALGTSLFGSRRLLALVSRYVDGDMVAAIAKEHRAGRRLYVLTSNIDSKRGVVWSIGAIAASGRPDSLDLIRKVLAASASIPLVFSPVLIDAEAGGHSFQEMHVDGNVTEAVFTLPLQYLAQQRRTRLSGGKIFILMNTTIEPQFSVVDGQTLKIVGASLNTLLTQKTLEDLATTYSYARVNRVDFNLTAIEPGVAMSGTAAFNTDYMRRLYAIGYDTARNGHFWQKTPPVGGAPEQMNTATLK